MKVFPPEISEQGFHPYQWSLAKPSAKTHISPPSANGRDHPPDLLPSYFLVIIASTFSSFSSVEPGLFSSLTPLSSPAPPSLRSIKSKAASHAEHSLGVGCISSTVGISCSATQRAGDDEFSALRVAW